MQEHDRRRVLWTSFAIENSDTINRHAAISCCRGRRVTSSLRRMTNDQRRRSCQRSSTSLHNFAPCRPGARSFRMRYSFFCRHRTDRPSRYGGRWTSPPSCLFRVVQRKTGAWGPASWRPVGIRIGRVVSALGTRLRLSHISWILFEHLLYSRPNGPMAVICITYSPDFAQWKCHVSPGRTITQPGGYACTFIAVEMFAQADVENAGHDCVDPVLRVFVRHQFCTGRRFDP